MAERRTAGWAPLSSIETRGEPALTAPLAEALSVTGRVERWTHGFHTYPAGLHPDSAGILLDLAPGRVWDPFCGGGTTLIEGLVRGRSVVGTDLSPVAALVSTGRTRVWTLEKISSMRSWARRITRDARDWTELPRDAAVRSVRSWYDPNVGRELDGIRDGIRRAPEPLRPMLRFLFSSLLIKVSHRRSDTDATRDARPRADGTTAILFHKKAREFGRKLEALAAEVPEGTDPAEIQSGSCLQQGPGAPVELVLTSPPYPGVYDYLPLQRLRLAWLGLDDRPLRDQELSPRRSFRGETAPALRRWNHQLHDWFAQVTAALVPDGKVGIVIGDGVVGGARVDSLQPLVNAGEQAGLRVLASASGARRDHGAGVDRFEHVIWMVKP